MRLSGWIVSGTFVLTSACDVSVDPDIDLTQVALTGRVFSADDARPVGGAAITTPGGQKAQSDRDGRFMVLYDADKGGSLKAESDKAAPVSKPAPKKSGYVELSVKSYDAQKSIETKKGGAVVADNAARVDIPGGGLKVKGGSDKPAQATVSIAAPDPRKSRNLGALPGNFDAKKGGKRGKLSADSPLYVTAKGDDKELDLADKKAKIDLPVHKNGAADKAAGKTLYRYDEEQGMWVEAGPVTRTTNDDGDAVYRCEISSLGWYAVGDFYDKLSCVRGCVKDANGEAAAGATVIATGVDHFSQVATYAGDDGCFVLDVRASSELSVVAQTISGIAGPELVTTSDEESSSDGDAGACAALGTLEIERRSTEDSECPLGANKCGDRCVDLSTDADHCGRCDTPCEGACTVGKCERGDRPNPADAGMDPDGDGGNMHLDSGVACECSSGESSTGHVLEGCCIGQGCGYRTDQIPLPFTESCFVPNPPRPLAGCPSVSTSTRQVSFGGCCLASGECGVATNEGVQGDTLLDFGFGCVSRAQAGLLGKATKCDPSPPVPDGGTSGPDSGIFIPDGGTSGPDSGTPISDSGAPVVDASP